MTGEHHFVTISVSTTRTGEYPVSLNDAELWKNAVKKVHEMDKIDGSQVGHWHIDLALRTVMTALETGINHKAWDCLAEALVMVQQVEKSCREHAVKKDGNNA